MDGLFRLSCASCVRSSRKPCQKQALSLSLWSSCSLVAHRRVGFSGSRGFHSIGAPALVEASGTQGENAGWHQKGGPEGTTTHRGGWKMEMLVYVIYFCSAHCFIAFCFCSDVMHDVNLTTMVSTWFRLMMNVSSRRTLRIWRNNRASHEEIVWLQNLHGTASQNQGDPVFISCAWPSESIYSPSLSEPPHSEQSSRI